jgi:hypothetical protein
MPDLTHHMRQMSAIATVHRGAVVGGGAGAGASCWRPYPGHVVGCRYRTGSGRGSMITTAVSDDRSAA